MRQGSVAKEVDLPFWLQLVGTGITAAWSLHFGAVHSHATWPAVNCHQLYVHDLLKKKIPVKNGFAPVPSGEGLGYQPDWTAIEKYQVDRPSERPDPDRMLETRWPDGRLMYTPNNGQVNFMLTPARKGTVPYFEKGVTTRLLPNDGSEKWKQMYEQGQQGPVLITP
jgi:galactonate dehydratase